MSAIVEKFEIFKEVPDSWKKNINTIFVSDDEEMEEKVAICATNNNLIYGFDRNSQTIFGYDNSQEAISPIKLNELCGNQFIEFFYSNKQIMFGITENNVFGWGQNKHGHLLSSEKSVKFLKPKELEYFRDKNIIKICIANKYSLALSSDGSLFGWGNYGNNLKKGQQPINFGDSHGLPCKITCIDCYGDMSVALGFNGQVFILMKESWTELLNEDQLKSLFSICKILVDKRIYFLTSDFRIYFNKNNTRKVEEIKTLGKYRVSDILPYTEGLVLQTEQSIIKFDLLSNPVELRNYNNLCDYFITEEQTTSTTIHIINNDPFILEFHLKYGEEQILFKSPRSLDVINMYKYNGKYKNLFIENYEIGRGSFAITYQVEEITKIGFISAVKVVELTNEDHFREIRLISQLRSEYIVEYLDVWIEEQKIFGKVKNYAYIQMQFCSQNLRDYLKILKSLYSINNEFNNELLNYYISCELFFELTECVNYLHTITESKPLINHRDLKPENILISDLENGRILKLCDFGISKVYEGSLNTRMQGTFIYMAPEVRNSNHYTFRSDIYSLALIATEIFGFDENVKDIRKMENLKAYYDKYSNEIIKGKFNYFLDLLSKCLFSKHEERPLCQDIINSKFEWSIDKSLILSEIQSSKTIEILGKYEFLFIKKWLESKFEERIQRKRVTSSEDFEDWSEIESGTFGTLYKVRHKTSRKYFAIKHYKSLRQSHKSFKEVEILPKLDNKYVVKYFESWIQDKKTESSRFEEEGYILLELCSQDVSKFLLDKNEIFKANKYVIYDYFMSLKLSQELAQCVNYLHQHNPRIIHRDIKPANVLMTEGKGDRFLKLCDFGSAKFIQGDSDFTAGQATLRYMSPEEVINEPQDFKSEIYKVSLVIIEIFGVKNWDKKHQRNLTEQLKKFTASNLKEYSVKFLNLLSNCLFPQDKNDRPEAFKLLEKLTESLLPIETLLNDPSTLEFKNVYLNSNNVNFKKFFQLYLP